MRENPSARRSKRWIQEALLTVMAEKPYSDITISEICKQADLTRPTFYQHFKSKEEVLLQYLDTLFQEFFVYMNEHGIKTIYELAFRFFSFWEAHYDFISLLEANGILDLLNMRFPQYLGRLVCLIDFAPKSISAQERNYSHSFLSGGLVSMLKVWGAANCTPDARTLAVYVDNLLKYQK